MPESIIIEQAEENNLQSVSLCIPHYKFIVVTGVSGSGKTSLIEDVICREGRRLFFGNFTSWASARMLSRPKVSNISGLFPVISISQSGIIKNPRSTVGTLTEINDLLRLLFARFASSTDYRPKPLRSLFSFNHPHGQCPECKGLGITDSIDPDLIVGNPDLSIREGALLLTTPDHYIIYSQITINELEKVCKAEGFSVDTPWKDLSEEQKKVIWYGSRKQKVLFGKHTLESRLRWTGITAKPRDESFYRGIIPVMEEILKRDRNPNILRFTASTTCAACKGKKLRPEALAFYFHDKNIDDFSAMELSDLHDYFLFLKENNKNPQGSEAIIESIIGRCQLLMQLSLGHLSPSRTSATLAEGELRRIRIAAQSACEMQNVLYVFDEPSAGLHPSEQAALMNIIRKLTDNRNTVIVAEHDESTMLACDHIIDIGPGPGKEGGEIIYNGSSSGFFKHPPERSISAKYLCKPRVYEPKTVTGETFRVKNASLHNLQNLDVTFRKACLNVITGVSGSGKSSLVACIIQQFLSSKEKTDKTFSKVIHIDQSPIGRTPKSNAATYTGLSDHIRDLLALQPESKEKGFKKGQFSFVVKGGRCEECGGAGIKQIGMHFLGNVEVICDACNGKRFTEETLAVRYKGKNIHDILEMNVEQAHDFFEGNKKIRTYTETMLGLGLGYLPLGQPATTLSGGEAQRIKLASELSRSASGETLYLLDEPTTGLHAADTEVLLEAIQKLVKAGHTVICTEHEPAFILQAGYIADLGPGSGKNGGALVASGTPADIMKVDTSITGRELKKYLNTKVETPYTLQGEEAKLYARPIDFKGISTHNLKNIDVTFPAGEISSVSGPAGSGKSSLIFDTVYAECQRRFTDGMSAYIRQFIGKAGNPVFDTCSGLSPAIALQKKNSSQNPRSTIATFTGLAELYRLMFSRLSENKGFSGPPPLSTAFSFNTEEGACTLCKGLGQIIRCNPDRLITHPELPLTEGALKGTKTGRFYGDPHGQYIAALIQAGIKHGINFGIPWNELDEKARNIALYGCGNEIFDIEWHYKRGQVEGIHRMKKKWAGFTGLVEEEYSRKHADHRGEAMMEIMMHQQCPECKGYRLKPDILQYTIGGSHIGELLLQTAEEALSWLVRAEDFFASASRKETFRLLSQQIKSHILAIIRCGLGYITMNRITGSLSGGEFQRLKLASLLHTPMTGIIYIIDEPSFSLHASDLENICNIIQELRSRGNTIILSEQRPEILQLANRLCLLGPEAGDKGGELLYSGTPENYITEINKLYQKIEKRNDNRNKYLEIRGASANNLREISLDIPLQNLCVITGVSGSGKTSLMREVIAASLLSGKTTNCRDIKIQWIHPDITFTEQDVPVGSALSIPLSYLGVMDAIRNLYAHQPSALHKSFKTSHFSFHHADGQCPECKGKGYTEISLDYWNDARMLCESCKGLRYKPEILEIITGSYSIGSLLQCSLKEISIFLSKQFDQKEWLKFSSIFNLAEKTGISYLRGGQSMNTLSTGEIQRLKLLAGIKGSYKNETLYLLDEPSGGLSPYDILNLMKLFDELIDNGSSIICVTHEPLLIRRAGCEIMLGPGGGKNGGEIIGIK